MEVTMSSVKPLVKDVLRVKLVPFLQSSPGVGKSSLAREIAEENELELIDLRLSQMDPADLNGFPFMQGTKKAAYVPMNVFPIEGDPLPTGKNGWLLLMDEFNSAPISVQSAAYKVVLDRQVGMHDLHKMCYVMAAGNLSTDKAITNRISTAMQSRLIHFTIAVDDKSWLKWADRSNIDHRVKSFIRFKPQALHKFDPNHSEDTFPCPRTWQFVSELIERYEDLPSAKVPLLAGTVGEGMAHEFFSFVKVYGELPTIEAIKRDPENVHFGPEPGVHYALAGLISHHLTPKTADKLMVFLSRLAIDHQVNALRAAIAKDPAVKKTTAVQEWAKRNARELT